MYRHKKQTKAVFMATNIKRQVSSGTVLTAFELFRNIPRLTEEEFAEFEKAPDRKQWSTEYREVEFD